MEYSCVSIGVSSMQVESVIGHRAPQQQSDTWTLKVTPRTQLAHCKMQAGGSLFPISPAQTGTAASEEVLQGRQFASFNAATFQGTAAQQAEELQADKGTLVVVA